MRLTASPYVPDVCAAATDPGRAGAPRRLGLSERAYGSSAAVEAALAAELGRAHLYPDASCRQLRSTIAETHGVSPDEVLVTNGADEALLLLALAYGSRSRPIAVPECTFLGYRAAAETARAPILTTRMADYRHELSSIAATLDHQPLVFVCNPHNPCGTVLEGRDLLSLAERCRATGALLVVDEAYIEYAPVGCSVLPLVADYPVVVVRSFSKSHGLAGVRCGFVIAARAVIDELRKLKHVLPFSVSRFALAAAEAALRDPGHTRDVVRRIVETRAQFCAWLDDLGLPYPPSHTNFVLVRTPIASGDVQRRLIDAGVLIKDAAGLGWERHVRIGIGTERDMAAVAGTLAAMTREEG